MGAPQTGRTRRVESAANGLDSASCRNTITLGMVAVPAFLWLASSAAAASCNQHRTLSFSVIGQPNLGVGFQDLPQVCCSRLLFHLTCPPLHSLPPAPPRSPRSRLFPVSVPSRPTFFSPVQSPISGSPPRALSSPRLALHLRRWRASQWPWEQSRLLLIEGPLARVQRSSSETWQLGRRSRMSPVWTLLSRHQWWM